MIASRWESVARLGNAFASDVVGRIVDSISRERERERETV